MESGCPNGGTRSQEKLTLFIRLMRYPLLPNISQPSRKPQFPYPGRNSCQCSGPQAIAHRPTGEHNQNITNRHTDGIHCLVHQKGVVSSHNWPTRGTRTWCRVQNTQKEKKEKKHCLQQWTILCSEWLATSSWLQFCLVSKLWCHGEENKTLRTENKDFIHKSQVVADENRSVPRNLVSVSSCFSLPWKDSTSFWDLKGFARFCFLCASEPFMETRWVHVSANLIQTDISSTCLHSCVKHGVFPRKNTLRWRRQLFRLTWMPAQPNEKNKNIS